MLVGHVMAESSLSELKDILLSIKAQRYLQSRLSPTLINSFLIEYSKPSSCIGTCISKNSSIGKKNPE